MDAQNVTDAQRALAETFDGPRDAVAPDVAVVDGFGVVIAVEREHLVARDGLGRHRRERQWSKVEAPKRVVVLGTTGSLSLAALRWCADAGTEVVCTDASGRLLYCSASSGFGDRPPLDDARLRRAQALAAGAEVGMVVVRYLLDLKLAGQAAVAGQVLHRPEVADTVDSLRSLLPDATDVETARLLESQAAAAYFSAWNGPGLRFQRRDDARVPAHWKRYGGRASPLTGRNQRAADPANAMLSYCYALAATEARVACIAAGLDPGMGLLHLDERNRQSMALDVMEGLRPDVDRFVLGLWASRIFARRDFSEDGSGHVRVLMPLSHHLASTMPAWARLAAPVAAHVARTFADAAAGKVRARPAPGFRRLNDPAPLRLAFPKAPPTCKGCGDPCGAGRRKWCAPCWKTERARLSGGARQAGWERAIAVHGGGWTTETFRAEVVPELAKRSPTEMAMVSGRAISTVARWKNGSHLPDPTLWVLLAALVGVSPPGTDGVAACDRAGPSRR